MICLGIHAATPIQCVCPSIQAMIALCNRKDKGSLTFFMSLSFLLCSFWVWLCSGFYYLLEAKFAGPWSFCLRVLLISASINLKQLLLTVHFPVLCFSGLAGKGMTYVICSLVAIFWTSVLSPLLRSWFCCGS